MEGRLNLNLRTKIVITFLALALVPLVLLSYIDARRIEGTLTNLANQSLSIASQEIADVIDSFLAEQLQEIQSASQLREFADYLNLAADQRLGSEAESKVQTTLRVLSRRQQIYVISYALLDEKGLNVLDTNPGGVGDDEANQTYFTESKQNEAIYISPVLFSETSTRVPSLFFSAPIYSVTGKVIGVLRARFSTALLQEFVAETAGLAGPASFSLLLDEHFLILGHSNNSELLFRWVADAQMIDEQDVRDLQAAKRLPERALDKLVLNLPVFAEALRTSGDPAIFVAELQPDSLNQMQTVVKRLSQAPWYIVFAQPRDVFLEPVLDEARTTFLLTTIIAVVVVAIAIFVSQQLANPIVTMTSIAQKMADGDLTARVPAVGSDERGRLAKAFNSMGNQLKDLVDSLEQQVLARTQRLETVANLGEYLSRFLDLDKLLIEVVNQIQARFNYYHVHIYLRDEEQDSLVVAEGTGPAGAQMKADKHHIPIHQLTSLVARAARSGEIVQADNVREAEDWLPNPLLPNTYSEMAIPIILEDQVVGVLDVQADRVAAFDETDASLLRSLASQVAVAIHNARLFTAVDVALAEARETETRYLAQAWNTASLPQRRAVHTHSRLDIEPRLPTEILTQAQTTALQEGQPAVIQVNGNESHLEGGPTMAESSAEDDVSVVVAPILLRGNPIGLLQMVDAHGFNQRESIAWTKENLAFVIALLEQVALAAENLRLLNEAQERANREALIGNITNRLQKAPDLDTLMQIGIAELSKALDSDRAFVQFGTAEELSQAVTASKPNEMPVETEETFSVLPKSSLGK